MLTDIKNQLRFFINGLVPNQLALIVSAWFSVVKQWLAFPLIQNDPLTCDRYILDKMAWERSIAQLKGESEEFYRKRVAFAYVNQRDAGSAIGLKKILERLELGFVTVSERVESRDWDVVVLTVDGQSLSDNSELLTELVALYGRTCRRYEFTVTSSTQVSIKSAAFNNNHKTFSKCIKN
jgi:P2-related tail formation protein